MAVTIPILPCRDVDEIIAFYESIGFTKTYRQIRPNPYVVVKLNDIELHFFGVAGFDPEKSLGTCSIKLDDVDGLYRSFVEKLRANGGRIPSAGIPRMTRPRKKHDAVYGFTLIDPGGNWIRIAALRQKADKATSQLARTLEAAVGLGDSHGEPGQAAATLDRALARSSDAPAGDRFAALVYRAELALALGDRDGARARLVEANALTLADDDRAGLTSSVEAAAALEEELGRTPAVDSGTRLQAFSA